MWMFFYENQEEFMKHYHSRSNVETTFSMIKGVINIDELIKKSQWLRKEQFELVMQDKVGHFPSSSSLHNLCEPSQKG